MPISLVRGFTSSLCVIVNPNFIGNEFLEEDEQSGDQDFPVILFFDSFGDAHCKNKISDRVRKWLNHEAELFGKFNELTDGSNPPFNMNTMEVFDPEGEK